MEESTVPVLETNTPRPPVRRSRTGRSTSVGLSSAQIHAYAPWALVAAVVILALAVLGVISIPGQKSEAWQAVFLVGGQAYFGHVARVTPNWLTLRDVHYLQTTPSVQPGATSPDIAIMKLGKELHGPEDEMRINRDHVLFIETLRSDSAVVRTIEAAQTQPEPADSGATVPAPSSLPQE